MLFRKLVVGAFFFSGIFLLTVETPLETVQPMILEVPNSSDACSSRDRKFEALKTQILSYKIDERNAELFSSLILKYSEEFIPNFDSALICGHFFAESSFRADAVNLRDPSYGLGQIMLPTAKQIAKDLNIEFPHDKSAQIRFLLDPENNVRFSLFYLSQCYRRFGCQKMAIAAYNGRPSLKSKHLQRVIWIVEGL